MLLKFMALLISIVPMVSPQDNVLHQGEAGDSQSVIVTARTRAFLSCESGDIVVKVNFTQPFRGLMYAHRSRSSPCRVHGTGAQYYELRIPLKGCGTWQESPRVFVNNITIRFHPALELEEDETKTVVCRYPPPLTPPPGTIHVIEPTSGPGPVPTRVNSAKLSEVEILIIICLLLFLSLLTLGIGIAYFCLKRRNIHIVRKGTVLSSAPPSQITRLSSSNVPPPSSLLSSVLGHTVRIPRAVPYSAPVGRMPSSVLSSPDHHYEEYPATSSTASGEMSETSVSSSSEDQADASKHLLFKKLGPRSLLSIPKAILRKSGHKKWQSDPIVHNYHSKASVGTSVRHPELEDQTVITVLDPEIQADDDHPYWTVRNGAKDKEKQHFKRVNEIRKSDTLKKPAPVYAQVDKNKKTTPKSHEINIEQMNISRPELRSAPRLPLRPTPLLGAARRQRTFIADIPEESSTSEEVTKNTTVTTSVRREVTETRIVSPHLNVPNDTVDGGSELSTADTDSKQPHTGDTAVQTADPKVVVHQPPRNILIRDVADIYLTTTVETESRELTTHVSRDVVEEHTRKDSPATTSPEEVQQKSTEQTPSEDDAPSPTDQWNVVIRQRKPPPDLQPSPPALSDSDVNSDSNGEDVDVKPKFDVKIRAIPPEELKPKDPQKMVSIPLFEMPQTVSKLKEALMPKTVESSPVKKLPVKDSPLPDSKSAISADSKERAHLPQRTVRWLDDAKATKDKNSTVSSSDSYQSAESLRERSSSEVLEVAPTLPSQRRNSDHPMLERSTSEIVTSPDDHVRWVGGVVPVLESLSPEFLANIPVVAQGGFFSRQKTPSPESTDKPKPSSS